MKKLAVIIVNYNVEHFLDQCLASVFAASSQMDTDIYVVDNNSVDGSVSMVKQKYPKVKIIENDFNAGFSKANNMAIQMSDAEYVLLLNPDTVVQEDTFNKVVSFMDQHPDAGGLGVKMVDGKGRFLPESKRGLPTPEVAFYKIFGLAAVFPASKRFGKYHLGYLDKEKVHAVEVLSGAFMLIRKSVLDKIGLLDEAFFMYGEDIDLSYRIHKAGYKNYYFPETSIIHYKGESTKKSSVNYVFVFYRAMVIFAQKHFAEKQARLFSMLINLAIWFRASLALLMRLIRGSSLFVTDVAVVSAGMILMSFYYQDFAVKHFPEPFYIYVTFVYSLVWIVTAWYIGVYDKPVRWWNILKSVIVGTIIILAVYGVLDKSLQFSRIYILFGAIITLAWLLMSRAFFGIVGPRSQSLSGAYQRRFVVVGTQDEVQRVKTILEQTVPHISFICHLIPDSFTSERSDADLEPQGIKWQNGLEEIINVHRINEIVFCARDVSVQDIIAVMSAIGNRDIDFKIAQPDTFYLIGSNSIHRSGDLYMLEVNGITRPVNRRLKRLTDILVSLLFVPLFPVLMWFTKRPFYFVRNIFVVLPGLKSWIGYGSNGFQKGVLPYIRKGIISPSSSLNNPQKHVTLRLDQVYARDYKVLHDIKLIVSNFKKLSGS